MNVRRNKEIKAVVTALTVAAALASGLLTARDANAAPPAKKKSTVTVKRATKSKPVYVKMSGNRRAAEVRAQQLYSQAIAQKTADEQAATAAQQQAASSDASSVVASSSEPLIGGVNPNGGFVQQVNVPGFGGQGPVVVGNSYGVGGITVGGFNGPSYPAGGYGFGNAGGIGYPSSIFFNSFNNGSSVFSSGLPYGTGFPSGF